MLAHYNPILSAIKGLCPAAHIAGGAVRDTLLERPIRDIDLFLDVAATDEAAKLLRQDFGFLKIAEWKNYELFSDPVCARVGKFEKADEEIPVSLIGLNHEWWGEARSMQENLARFDFGICMAGWDGAEVRTTDEYKRDIEQKTFTLCRADSQSQFNYSMSRFKKMTADRYAGWKLAIPKRFDEMAMEHALEQTHYFDDETDMWMPREEMLHGVQMLTPKAR